MTPAPDLHSLVDSRRAWFATVGAALSNGLAFGLVYSFGTFFDEMADEFESGRGSVALIFGVSLLLFFGSGIVAGPMSDRFGPRPLLAFGGGLMVAGLFVMSEVESLAQGAVTYAVGLGLGGGCFISSVMATAGGLFTTKRALAIGVVATGSGLGTLVLVPVSEALINAGDWRSAYRWLALIAAVGFLVSLMLLVRPPVADGATNPITFRLLGDRTFMALFVVAVMMSIGLFVAFAFVIPFAEDDGISSAAAARLVATVGLASIVGRLGLTAFASVLGPIRLLRVTLVILMASFGLWALAGGSYPLLVLFAIVLGVAYGGFVAISPEVALVLFGANGIGRLMGYLYASFGIGGLIGPPLAGAIDSAGGEREIVIGLILALLAGAVVISSVLEAESQ